MVKTVKCKKALLLFWALVLFCAPLVAMQPQDYIVQDLRVEDIPNDDGTGLMLVWKPLPKEAAIIEYRIYRGVTPDSLFFIGQIDVDPKTGIVGDKAYYYDSDVSPLADIDSPARLKQEDQQEEDSPLYGAYPRDVSVLEKELKNYTVYGYYDLKELMYKSERIERSVKGENKPFAGLAMHQLRLLKKLIANKKYYYTVVAVDQSRKFHKYAEPTFGIGRVNLPSLPKNVHAVYIKDEKKIQLEWSSPVAADAIGAYGIYLLSKDKLESFNLFSAQNTLLAEKKIAGASDSTLTGFGTILANPATLIGQAYDTRTTIDLSSLPAETNLEDYLIVVSSIGITQDQLFIPAEPIKIISSTELPALPEFTVSDFPEDKGDANQVYWGKPVVYVSKCTFLSDRKVLVNYEMETNPNYVIKNIYFTFTTAEGEKFAEVNEYFQDLKVKISLPEGYDAKKGISVKITMKTNKGNLGDDYSFTQKINYNETTLSLFPDKVYFGDEPVNDFRYIIFKKSKASPEFAEVKKQAGIQRSYTDNIRYEMFSFAPIRFVDAAKKRILIDPFIDLGFDEKTGRPLRTSVFLVDAKKDSSSYEIIQKANSLDSDKARMKFLEKYRNDLKRNYAYKLMKTDGKGSFVLSEEYKDEAGNTYFYPQPNWFKKSMTAAFIATILFGIIVWIMIKKALRGDNLYIRPIAGIQEIDNAIGRATEMGRPILFQPGMDGYSAVATLAGLSILGRVAKKAAEYDTRIIVPLRDYLVLPIAQEIVKEAHYEAGRPDTYDKSSVFYITDSQFAFVAGVNGIMVREKTATNFYMGGFYAEALLMTETGNATGAIQIAGTDATTQIPFFITTCDYTLIGEELYAASAYLAREPMMLGTLKAQDYFKFIMLFFIILGTILTTAHITFLINYFPEK